MRANEMSEIGEFNRSLSLSLKEWLSRRSCCLVAGVGVRSIDDHDQNMSLCSTSLRMSMANAN